MHQSNIPDPSFTVFTLDLRRKSRQHHRTREVAIPDVPC